MLSCVTWCGLVATILTTGGGFAGPVNPVVTSDGRVVDVRTGRISYLVQIDAAPGEITQDVAGALIDRALAASIDASQVQYRYTHALVGFAAWMTEAEAATLRRHPDVRLIEFDGMSTTASDHLETDPNEPVPWGLRRISDPDGLAPAYDPCAADGTGVTAIVIDSGIQLDQTLFSGRIREAVSFAGAPGGSDVFGHGTHVAGIMAGTGVGVAPAAEIVALRTSNDQGQSQNSAVIAALNWIANPSNIVPPAVVNMSISEPVVGQQQAIYYQTLEAGVQNGFPIFAAAGNDSVLPRWGLPASCQSVTTVGATNVFDHPTLFSCSGPTVDIWAPGGGILSADWEHPDGGRKFDSGTSQATPAAAGVAMLFCERHVSADDIANEPDLIGGRVAIALARSAAVGKLTPYDDPILGSPGGNGVLGGSVNRLLQACDAAAGIACDEDEPWLDATQSMVLGDGITPIPGSFQCARQVQHPGGPVRVTVNRYAIAGWPLNPAGTVTIDDAATGQTLWSSDVSSLLEDDYDLYRWAYTRTVTSSSVAGLTVTWTSHTSDASSGYGYVMTANVASSCPSDITGDGSVDTNDLLAVIGSWGPCPPTGDCAADLDGTGDVGVDDLMLVLTAWGACPLYTPPSLMRDCNGNLVPTSMLGDSVLDNGVREILLDPVLAPTEPTVVDLNCEALGWDTLDGNSFTISPDDPRLGACGAVDGECVQATWAACQQAGGQFWGRGVPCGDTQTILAANAPVCVGGELGYGSVIDFDAGFMGVVNDGYTSWRQQVSAGLTSISKLRWAALGSSLASSKANVNAAGGSHGLPVFARPCGITIYYTDGGSPDFIRRVPTTHLTNGHIGAAPIVVLEFDDVLADGVREIHSIRLTIDPDAPGTQSSTIFTRYLGAPLDAGATDPTAEYSRDGGKTWYPILYDGQGVQMSVCITP